MLHTTGTQPWFIEDGQHGIATGFALKMAKKLYSEQTAYQLIEIYETTDFGKLFVFDGLVMLTERDNFLYHEMLTHPALLSHPHPQRVAIIGGGDCGTLREVAKHPQVTQITQIEIDERVTRIAETFFPELCSANQDPRVTLAFTDGIRWMAEAADDSLDVILIDSTDPIGFATGLFQAPFYRDCLRVLGKNGILAQQSESPFLHGETIAAMQRAIREVGFAQTQLLPFPQPCYPSGWWSITVARTVASNAAPRPADGLNTQYYQTQTWHAAMALPPFLQQQLNKE